MKPTRLIAGVLVVVAAFAAGIGYDRWKGVPGDTTVSQAAAPRYHCPMHPDYQSDRPGTCPICGMTLVAMETSSKPPAEATPEVQGTGSEPPVPPPGSIRVSAEKQQLIGVTYGQVEQTRDSRSIHAVGTMAIDDTRVTKVHPRVEGWVEKVFADETGRLIAAGQPLVSIFSPDLLARQQEFLLALRTRDAQRGDPTTEAQNDRLVAAARKRLELCDLGETQIEQIASTRTPIPAVLLTAPATGYVVTRNAYPRQRVTVETELFTIADMRHLWVQAEVYEHDAAFIRPGQAARVTISYTGRTIDARVVLLAPSVDPATRTLKVRLDVSNPGLTLRPDMFVDVEFAVREASRLTVPISAVLDSGARKTVFVDRGNGFLEPREVQTGTVIADRIEVLSGLTPGERIVTSGTFLLDSESQLKSGPSSGPPPPPSAPTTAPPTGTPGAHQHGTPTAPRASQPGGRP